METTTKFDLTTKNVLTFLEACEYCGFSKPHMYRLTSLKQIPHYKPSGKMVYFDRVELEKWLMQTKVEVEV